MLRTFKYVAKAVLLEEKDGEVVGEHTTEEAHLYSKAQVEKWLTLVDEFATAHTDKANNESKADNE
jgi:hypothetical protein